jgi:toxin ParE1/3/4
MPFKVWLTDDAARDLADILDHIVARHGAAEAAHVINQIKRTLSSLNDWPERGAYPKELLALGIREYREVFFKPYRVIFRVVGDDVFVLLIADGRRDFQALLQRRLLDA